MSRGGPQKLSAVREEVRRVVKGTAQPLLRDEIGNRLKVAAGKTRLTKTLSNMRTCGELVSARGPDGMRYSAGPKLTGGGMPAKAAKTAGTKGLNASPKLSARDAAVIEGRLRDIQQATLAARRIAAGTAWPANDRSAPRWALTSDGAFVLIGTPIEIPKPAAHALVAFVDVLRKGEA